MDPSQRLPPHWHDPADPAAVVRGVTRVTLAGMVVNALLVAAKLAAGAFGGSRALVADALHSLSDLSTDIGVLVGIRYWTAPADSSHPHGHRKIEQLITLAIAGALMAVGVYLARGAVLDIVGGDTGRPPPRPIAFAVAAASVLVKEWLYRWTLREGKRYASPAVIANAWHHRSDALSSIPAGLGVLGAYLGAHFGRNLSVLDLLAAVVVACMIIHAAWSIGRSALNALADAGAEPALIARVKRLALAVDGVRSMHKVRTRHLGPDAAAVDLHIQVDGRLDIRQGHCIAGAVKQSLLANAGGVVDVIIHVEPVDEEKIA